MSDVGNTNPQVDLGNIDLNLNNAAPVEPHDSSSLLNSFLQGIPDQDRPIVQKYMKDWDSGVTKQFQKIHDEYKPFKELKLTPDELVKAEGLWEVLNSDPHRMYRTLAEMIENGDIEVPEEFLNNNDDQSNQPQAEQEPAALYEGLPQAFLDRFQQMEQALLQVGEHLTTQQEQAQIDADNKVLDDLLGNMHTTHGEFDEDFILAKLASGHSPEQAIESYKSFVASLTAPKNTPSQVPAFLSGNGGVPTSQGDPTKLNSKQTQQLMVEMLKAANGNS